MHINTDNHDSLMNHTNSTILVNNEKNKDSGDKKSLNTKYNNFMKVVYITAGIFCLCCYLTIPVAILLALFVRKQEK